MKGKPHNDSGHFFRHDALISRQVYLIVALFVAIILCLLALDRFQAYVLDATRAYVAGEGLWSKGQKDAVYHLLRYAETQEPVHYRLYEQGLTASLGDRQARLALQEKPPDPLRARQGFLTGGNHPDDIAHLISLFINFSNVQEMHQAIDIWTEADRQIDELRKLGKLLDKEITSTQPEAARIIAIRNRIDAVNSRLNGLENSFSATLGDAARKIRRITRIAMFAATLMLLLTGIYLSLRILQRLRDAETKLLASEARFRYVVESNLVGIMFWHHGGTIIDANDALLSMLGHSREELTGGMLNWRQMTPPEFRTRTEHSLQEIEQQGRARPYEKAFLHKDGHQVPVLITSARFNGIEENGISFVLDISEHKRAEQLQRVAATVFNAAQEGIMVTDRDGIIKAVNPSFTAITGYDADEATGKNPSLLSSGKHPPDFYHHMWQELQQHGSWKGDIWNRRKNGELYQEWLTVSAIRDERDEISEYIGVFSDITEQRQLEEQLRQSQKMEAIGTLVGGIAHDFNNTLAAVEGNLFLAKQQEGCNPALSERLDKIETLSSHSAEMVRQLLAFARKDIVRRKPLYLNKFLENMASLTDTIIPENIAFAMHYCEKELTVLADTGQLQQVLLNLLNNARDALFSSENPHIALTLDVCEANTITVLGQPLPEDTPLAHITIRDNGTGIRREEMEHIFEPFFTTKEVGKGTGLGLSMAYGSIRSQGGAIVAESIPGQGTTMHLYLPLIEGVETPEVSEYTISTKETTAPALPATLLLVDDNHNLRQVSAESLHSLGYNVIVANNGMDALTRFAEQQRKIDLLITDVVMPGLGGFQLATKVREKDPGMPVIFITGYDPEQSPIPELLAERSEILCKPFTIENLAATARRLLKSKE